jgi:hypothetical protein
VTDTLRLNYGAFGSWETVPWLSAVAKSKAIEIEGEWADVRGPEVLAQLLAGKQPLTGLHQLLRKYRLHDTD